MLLHQKLGTRFVSVNGIYLPGNKAINYLRGCCAPIWGYNFDPRFQYSLKGASVLCERKGNLFCLFAAHQLKDSGGERSPDQIFVSLRETGGPLIRGSGCLLFRSSGRFSEYHDVCAMLLPAWLVEKHKDRNALFIKLRNETPEADGSEYAFALGYPHKMAEFVTAEQADGEYGFEEVHINQLRVHGAIGEGRIFDLPYLQLYPGDIVKDICNYDLSGFSGGPVFSIHRRHKTAEFRGMVVTAGKDRIRYVPTDAITEFLDGFSLGEPGGAALSA
jgi:hypothetical protein